MRGYLAALVLTLVIEVPVASVWLRRLGTSLGRALLSAVAVNMVSHPLAFLVVWPLLDRVLPAAVVLAAVELAVIAGEAVGYRRLTRVDSGSAVQIAALANVASLAFGWFAVR